MDKEQIKEVILGKENCRLEDTPLCQFATFHPDMEIVEILLKGADIQKSFNNQPLGWVFQFCEPNWDKMLQLLFKYKYHSLQLHKTRDFEYLLRLLNKVKTEIAFYVLNTMKRHNFHLTPKQTEMIGQAEYAKVLQMYLEVFNSKGE